MTSYFEKKKVLVTGGTGLIGRPLVDILVQRGANVRVVSLDEPVGMPKGIEVFQKDLRLFDNCLAATAGMDVVFHLAGIKGSPQMAAKKPASFFVPMLLFNTNLLEAARQSRVPRLLYTSSIGVYGPSEIMREDDVWSTFPSPHDRFGGWAKRMGELQLESYRQEYAWSPLTVVRPANVYGPFDNFDPANAMVIPSLIERILSGENPLSVWGDGSAIRDFVFSSDVAQGMVDLVEKGVDGTFNLGSGQETSIAQLVLTLQKIFPGLQVKWDPSKPRGDHKRLLDISRAGPFGYAPRVGLEEGLRLTVDWYKNNRSKPSQRYNAFTNPNMLP